MYSCPLCSTSFPDEKALHKHVRFQEKLKLEEFYTTYLERFDLFDQEPIPWKNDASAYMSSLFRSRVNLVKYCRKFPDKAREVIKQVILLRSKQRNLDRMLSTVEARSVIYPTVLLAESLNIDWCEMAKELSLACRYDYHQKITFKENKDITIFCDTREQSPLAIDPKIKVIRKGLNFGDYTSPSHFSNTYVERKSLNDFCGTMSAGFDRFNREMVRAAELDARIVVLIESNLNEVFLVGKTPKTQHIKATSEFLLHRMRSVIETFENVQFLFVDDRAAASRALIRILLMTNDIKTIDLQYLYDAKKV